MTDKDTQEVTDTVPDLSLEDKISELLNALDSITATLSSMNNPMENK